MDASNAKCFFCGFSRHQSSKCAAREVACHKCQKKGHYAKVCRSYVASASVTLTDRVTLATVTLAATPGAISKAVAKISIKGIEADEVIESGNSESFIHPDLVKRHSCTVQHSQSVVTMASTSLSALISGFCRANLMMNCRNYERVRLTVLLQLCFDVILDQDCQRLHGSVTLTYGCDLPPLVIC